MAEKFTTPFAECMYPFLQQPKVDPKGKYPDSFQIVLLLKEEHKDLLNQISELHKEAGGTEKTGDKGHPIKFHEDVEKNTIEGIYRVLFKTLVEGKGGFIVDHVKTFDSKGVEIFKDKNFLGNGSVVRVNWSYKFYDERGNKGVALFLNGVQIKKLIEWHGGDANYFGFDEQEGYETEKPKEPEFPELDDATQKEHSDEIDKYEKAERSIEEQGDMITEAKKKAEKAANTENDDLPLWKEFEEKF